MGETLVPRGRRIRSSEETWLPRGPKSAVFTASDDLCSSPKLGASRHDGNEARIIVLVSVRENLEAGRLEKTLLVIYLES